MNKKKYQAPAIIVMGSELDSSILEVSNKGTEDMYSKKREDSNLIEFGFNSSSSEDDDW